MLKLSRNGIGALTSQYKSVLKKCAWLNMLAAGVFLFASNATAAATGADFEYMGNTVNYYDEGDEETDEDIAYLFSNEQYMTTKLFTDFIPSTELIAGTGGWVKNYGEVYVGQNLNPVTGRLVEVPNTVISNKHNMYGPEVEGERIPVADIIPASGGGAITNLSKQVEELDEEQNPVTIDVGSKLSVVGSTFQNNSATDFTKAEPLSAYEAVGGAISNLSLEPVTLKASSTGTPTKFVNNYTMQFVNAYAGALYNGFAKVDYDAMDFEDNVENVGIINSTDTVYSGNHAGNEYLNLDEDGNIVPSGSATLDLDVYHNIMEQLRSNSRCLTEDCPQRTMTNLDHNGNNTSEYALSDYAYGGAVYNLGEYNSINETYTGNYTIGQTAMGGAVYNSNFNTRMEATGEDLVISQISSFNISEKIEFKNNKTVSYETNPESDEVGAHGGAVYNLNKMNFETGSSAEFEGNKAQSYWNSRGGALNNDMFIVEGEGYLGEIATIRNARFAENIAETIKEASSTTEGEYDGAVARGGAIYNAGKMTIADADFVSNEVKGVGTSEIGANDGGAIYNGAAEQLTGGYLVFDNENSSKSITFTSNKAQGMGGAIYNGGADMRGIISQQMLFENNEDSTDTSGETLPDEDPEAHGGGAIYNAVTPEIGYSNIQLLLTGEGNVLFKTHGYDNVYNDVARDENGNIKQKGLIQFGGKNFTAHAFGVRNNSDSPRSTVTTNASFLGFGEYQIVNTQLELGSTSDGAGYISYNPTMNMAYSEIILHGTGVNDNSSLHVSSAGDTNSYMYLSSDNDSVIDNDFYLDPGAVLRYDDKESTWSTGNGVYNAYGIKNAEGAYVFDEEAMLAADEADGDTVNGYINFDKYFAKEEGKNFYLGQYIQNKGYIVYDDSVGKDSDIGIAHTLDNYTGGVIHSAYDGYITQNIHIGTLDSRDGGGKITINMDNSNLYTSDSLHDLVEKADAGEFGYYLGEHYASEVITIDKEIYDQTIVVFYNTADEVNQAKPYGSEDPGYIQLDEGQRIYFAQTPGEHGVDPELYSFEVANAYNPDYTIKVGYDYREKDGANVYDWFLYRESDTPGPTPPEPTPGITPEELAMIDLPRSAIEQVRSLRLPLNRTNKGQCNCYNDQCDNRFCKFEDGRFRARMWATPFYRNGSFEKPIDTDFNLFGVDFGMDFQPTTKDEIGFFGSYRTGKYKNDGNKKHAKDSKMKYFSYDGSDIKLNSWLGGAYYRRYIGDLYLMGAMFGGKIDADLKGKNNVKLSTDGMTVGAQAEMGYDIRVTNRSVLTPMVRGTYNYIEFDDAKDSVGKEASFEDIHSFEIEGALKFEYQFNNERQLPTTGYIKPSVIQLLNSGGEVTVDKTVYKKTLEDETIGRVEVGFDAELVRNLSLGVFGNYSFGSDYDAWGVGGNVRLVW